MRLQSISYPGFEPGPGDDMRFYALYEPIVYVFASSSRTDKMFS